MRRDVVGSVLQNANCSRSAHKFPSELFWQIKGYILSMSGLKMRATLPQLCILEGSYDYYLTEIMVLVSKRGPQQKINEK